MKLSKEIQETTCRMEQAGPYLCLYFGLSQTVKPVCVHWQYALISAAQDECNYSIIFKFIFVLQLTLTFWYQNLSPANVSSIATSRVVRLEEI